MALLFMDSFDHFVTADLSKKYGTVTSATIQAAAGRRGSQALRLGDVLHALVTPSLPVSGSVMVLGIAVKISSVTSGGDAWITVRTGGTNQCSLGISTTGYLQAWRNDSSGTLLGTATTGALRPGAFAHVEFKATVHPSVGTIDVRVNGATVLTLTGVNTAHAGTSVWDNIAFTGQAGVAALDLDDLYVLDGSGNAPWNTFLGDRQVHPCYPTGAGATSGWVASTGANWSCVDDAMPNADTDYVSAASADLTDTYALQDLPVVGGTIYGVQYCLAMKKSDAGACTIAPVIRHSGVDYPGAALSPGTAYAYGLQIAQVNPATGAPWTESDFNAGEYGYRRTT